MADITALRNAIANNIMTISGLRASGTLPDLPNPPIAVVSIDTVDYHRAFSGGLTQYNFTVTLIVGRVSERTSQNSLDAYCSPTGPKSVKVAIESDRTLNGLAYDLIVSSLKSYGSMNINENLYLAAEFDLTVQAN